MKTENIIFAGLAVALLGGGAWYYFSKVKGTTQDPAAPAPISPGQLALNNAIKNSSTILSSPKTNTGIVSSIRNF
jgi:hypothetical protein